MEFDPLLRDAAKIVNARKAYLELPREVRRHLIFDIWQALHAARAYAPTEVPPPRALDPAEYARLDVLLADGAGDLGSLLVKIRDQLETVERLANAHRRAELPEI